MLVLILTPFLGFQVGGSFGVMMRVTWGACRNERAGSEEVGDSADEMHDSGDDSMLEY